MLAYVASQAEGARPTSDGTSHRAYWEHEAQRGNAVAAAKLAGAPYPDALSYLHDWFLELSNARPVSGMGGIAGLTYEGIEAWARLTDRHPEPYEIDALFQIDSAWRAAMLGDEKKPGATTESAPPVTRAWPEKKPESSRSATPEGVA